jgi:arylsulfatase
VDAARTGAIRAIGAGAVAASIGTTPFTVASAAAGPGYAIAAKTPSGPYDILFNLTDQVRCFRPGELPAGYRLPARERLAQRGIAFGNHQINSCVCTPSRSVVYTGRHTGSSPRWA